MCTSDAGEGKVKLSTVGNTTAKFIGQVTGGQAHNHVLDRTVILLHGNVQVQLAAHHLGHVHCSYQGTLALASGDKADVLGTDAQHDVLGSGIAGFQLFLNLLRQLYLGAGAVDVIPVAILDQMGVEEVHLRHTDEAGHEHVQRVVEHLLGGAHLLG